MRFPEKDKETNASRAKLAGIAQNARAVVGDPTCIDRGMLTAEAKVAPIDMVVVYAAVIDAERCP